MMLLCVSEGSLTSWIAVEILNYDMFEADLTGISILAKSRNGHLSY